MRQLRQAHAWSPARHLTDIADVAYGAARPHLAQDHQHKEQLRKQPESIFKFVRRPLPTGTVCACSRSCCSGGGRCRICCGAPCFSALHHHCVTDAAHRPTERAERDRLGLPPAVCQRAARQDGPKRVGGRTECTWSEPWLIGGAGEAIVAPAGIAGTAPGERAEVPGQIMPACAYICWGIIVCIGGQPICC